MRVLKTILLTVGGFLIGVLGAGAYIDTHNKKSDADYVPISLMIAGPVAGFLISRRLGRRS